MMTPADIKAELRGQANSPQVRALLALISGQRDADQAALVAPSMTSEARHYYAGAVAAMTGLLQDASRCLDLDTKNPAR